jgi:hypothetical protein
MSYVTSSYGICHILLCTGQTVGQTAYTDYYYRLLLQTITTDYYCRLLLQTIKTVGQTAYTDRIYVL